MIKPLQEAAKLTHYRPSKPSELRTSAIHDDGLAQLTPQHLSELRASAISDAIIAANFQSVAGDDVLEWLTEHKLAQLGGHAQQYATASVRRLLDQVEPLAEAGGWRFQGLDPLNNWAPMDWGCFKPDQPRFGWKKDRHGNWTLTDSHVKYEHPQGIQARAFFADLDRHDPARGRDYWTQVETDKTLPIVLAEGAKKTCCLQSHGYAAIGLPGVAMWNQPKTRTLIAELDRFAIKNRVFYICFDQDIKRRTRRAVGREMTKLSSALRRRGCKVKVIQWNPALGKGVDDLIAAHGPEAFLKAYNQAISAEVVTVQRMSELSFTPDWVAPEGIKYLTDAGLIEAISPIAKLVGIKAAKGTGKTAAIAKVIDQARDREQRTLVIVHRIQLAKAIGDRTGLLSIYEVVREKGEDRRIKLAEVDAHGMSLCAHSCHPDSQARFKADDWLDALVVMDECTQVLWDLLNSSILKGKRVPILKEIQALLAGVLSPETQGRLFLLDADLDDITVDGVRRIAGQPELKPWIAVSHYQAGRYPCHVHKNRHQWLMQAEQDLSDGLTLLVMTDSQDEKGNFSSTALETRWTTKYPDLRILRIDSSSLTEKGHPAMGCIQNANAVFSRYDVVICSPSVETGISLDLKDHFDRVYGCYQGVLSENSVRQSLARLREPVDRVIYAATRGLEAIGGGDTYWKALIENVSQKANAITGDLMRASVDVLGGAFLTSALELWAKYAARHNAGMAAYRETIMAQLRAEGHTVTEEGDPDSAAKDAIADIKAEAKVNKHERLMARGIATCNAEAISDEVYDKRAESTAPQTAAQTLEMARKRLSKRYGTEPTLDLFMLDQDGWREKIRLHYYLTVGREQLRDREQEQLTALIEASAGQGLWLPDVARSSRTLKIWALDWLQVPQLLELAGTNQVIYQDHPLVIDIIDKAQSSAKSRKAIRLALGITVTDKTKPVALVRELLGKVGFKLRSVGTTGPRESRSRTYQVEQVDYKRFEFGSQDAPIMHEYSCSRAAIFEQWLGQEQLTEAVATAESVQTAKTVSQRDSEPVCPEETVCSSGNSRSISTLSAYTPRPTERQTRVGHSSPAFLPQLEQLCLSILLRLYDYWGQLLGRQPQRWQTAQRLIFDELDGRINQCRWITDSTLTTGTSWRWRSKLKPTGVVLTAGGLAVGLESRRKRPSLELSAQITQGWRNYGTWSQTRSRWRGWGGLC